MLSTKRISSIPEDSGRRLNWLSQKSKKLKLSQMDAGDTKMVGRFGCQKLNWPMQCRNRVFCLLKKRCLASRRELCFSFARSRCLWTASTSYSVSSPLSMLMMLPSCHMPSMKKSTTSPTSRSASTQRFASFSLKAALRFWNSACSSPPRRAAIFCTILWMSLDSLKDQQSRSFRQSEQAGLCLRASSRQGRQKAWPQWVMTGWIMSSRHTGQLNFSGLAIAMYSSLLKSTFLVPFSSLSSPCILLTTRCRNCCLLMLGLATIVLFFLGAGCSSKAGRGSGVCRRVFTITVANKYRGRKQDRQVEWAEDDYINNLHFAPMKVIEMGRRDCFAAVQLSQDKSVIMNHQHFRGNRFRAKPTSQSQLQVGQQIGEACSKEAGRPLTPHSPTQTKDKHALTVRHQNVEHCRESASLSTQYRAAPRPPKLPADRSPSNPQKENCLSPKARLTSKHKINYSILQRIHRALELYPSIAHQRNPIANLPNFATQSEEEYQAEGLINLSKLVLWRQSKLLKIMDRVYDGLSEHRDEKMRGQKRASSAQCSIQKGLRQYLLARHKTDKLCRENFINLCYSLYYYFDKAHYEHAIANTHQSHGKLLRLTTFQQFLHLQLSDSQLTFYLYSRALLIGVKQEQSSQTLSMQQMKEFLALLSHGDAVMYQYYKEYITKRLGRINEYQNHQVLHLLLEHFQLRKKSSTSLISNPTASQIQEDNEGSTSLLGVAYDSDFWKTDPPPQQNMQEELYERMLEEIGRQTKKLMSYFQVQSGRHRETVSELVLIKAIRMLNAAHAFDKYRWFKQLQLVKERVLLAKSSDFAQLQSLHHDLREISQSHLNNRLATCRIVDFSKKLLTTRAFVDKLQQLFELFGQ